MKAPSLFALLFVLGVAPVQATPQQDKMTACNKDASAKELKGEARKTFMSQCLKKDGDTAKPSNQQEKMTWCNKEAGDRGLKGEERKTFMSGCLKK